MAYGSNSINAFGGLFPNHVNCRNGGGCFLAGKVACFVDLCCAFVLLLK